MVRMLMTDTAKLLRFPRTKTRYRYEPDLTDPTEIFEGKCSCQPFLGLEDEVDRDTRTSQLRLVSDDPGFFVALATDYIEYDGVLWKIDGRPFKWTLRGAHHIELNMRLVEG